ncbi:MAG: DUF881 domain-containing protein [bacterium]|nr:DUF881 domain-containing protein [bacterium]
MTKNFLLAFLLTGFVMGLLLTWQFGTKVPVEGSFPSDQVSARDDLLKEFLNDQSYLQSRIVSLRKDKENKENSIELHTETANFELLEGLKASIGLTEVTGGGLEILLDDNPLSTRDGSELSDLGLVQASDVRDIVNILNASSAEAISVNNQRVVAVSPISSVGTTILVNNSHIAPPFVITAIGDSEVMLQRLLDQNLLPNVYKRRLESKIIFEITKKNRLTVSVYNGDLKTSYLNLVE